VLKFVTRLLSALAVLSLVSGSLQAAPVGYSIDVTTFYQFDSPPDLTFSDFGTAAPDTGFWRVTNTGTTTFSGTIGQNAVAGDGIDFSYSHAVTLAPGASVVFAVNEESSNHLGYNGPFGSTQPGVEIFLTGLFDGTEAVTLSVFDRDIHSGVPRLNPLGETLDSYVLQGGSAFGGDTFDDFEVTQTPGRFQFVERIPEPGTLLLAVLALVGIAGARRRAVR